MSQTRRRLLRSALPGVLVLLVWVTFAPTGATASSKRVDPAHACGSDAECDASEAQVEVRALAACTVTAAPGTVENKIIEGCGYDYHPGFVRPPPEGVGRLDDDTPVIADAAGVDGRVLRVFSTSGVQSSAPQSAAAPFLRGTAGNAGRVPASVRSALDGQTFSSREAFRRAFWRAAGDDPAIASQFSRSNQTLMRNGRAPIAPSSQHFGGRTRYELHHITPVSRGGAVYDLDNIVVVTPRYHRDVLSGSYHYGGGG